MTNIQLIEYITDRYTNGMPTKKSMDTATVAMRLALRTIRRQPHTSSITISCHRCYATSPPPPASSAPPLLSKLRADLKDAMRVKDTDRLNVLRGLLADITNAAKTSSPIQSDMQVLALLRKRAAAAKSAGQEFAQAGRQDLLEQEQRQTAILEGYAGTVSTMEERDIRAAVTKVIDEVKATASGPVNMGDVLKKLIGPGGSLENKPVEKSQVAVLVKQALS